MGMLIESSASTATLVRLRFLLALLDSQTFLYTSIKIALWTVIELAIGIFAGSLPHLRPLLRYLPFVHDSSNHDTPGARPSEMRGKSQQASFRMDTYKTGTFVEAGRVKRNLGDGDSEEHILEARPDRGRDPERFDNRSGIRKQTTYTMERI